MELCGVGLARRGHRVWFAGRRESRFLRRVSVHPETTVRPLDIGGDFNPRTIWRVARMLREERIDLVLCNFVKDVRLAGLGRRLADGCKIIWAPGVNLAKKSFSHKWLFSGFVDSVVVPSRHLRDAIIASGYIDGARFEVIPIGIDENLWRGSREEGRAFLKRQFDLPESSFICLTSGRFVRQKGHCYLIEAARELARKYDDIFFLLLGDGPLEPVLLRQIREQGLTDRFVFCGLLDHHQRAVFGADLYVHPAVIEPYGIVIVEAMAAGLPVVATRVGGIPEVAAENETALLVDPAEPDQLTEAVERFYTDAGLRKQYAAAGYERFGRLFRYDIMVDAIEKILVEAATG